MKGRNCERVEKAKAITAAVDTGKCSDYEFNLLVYQNSIDYAVNDNVVCGIKAR